MRKTRLCLAATIACVSLLYVTRSFADELKLVDAKHSLPSGTISFTINPTDGQCFVILSQDRGTIVSQFNPETAECKRCFRVPYDTRAALVASSTDGTHVAFAEHGNPLGDERGSRLCIGNIRTGKVAQKAELEFPIKELRPAGANSFAVRTTNHKEFRVFGADGLRVSPEQQKSFDDQPSRYFVVNESKYRKPAPGLFRRDSDSSSMKIHDEPFSFANSTDGEYLIFTTHEGAVFTWNDHDRKASIIARERNAKLLVEFDAFNNQFWVVNAYTGKIKLVPLR